MSRGPLIETAVVGNAAMEGRTVLEWEKDDVDALGLASAYQLVRSLAVGKSECRLRR